MSDHLKKFYTLEEVRSKLTESINPKLSSDQILKKFIDAHILIPYVYYKGFVNPVKSVYSKNREVAIKEFSVTINEDIADLQLKELIDPQRYDLSLDIEAIIYQTRKLLSTFMDEYDDSYDNNAYYSEGIFSISPENIILNHLGLKVNIDDLKPISHHVKFIFNNPFDHTKNDCTGILLDHKNKYQLRDKDNLPSTLKEDEVSGWILHMPDSDYQSILKLEKKCELIFSSQDFNHLLHRIENINLAPKLDKDLKETNRLISQQNKEIEKLKKQIEISTKPSEGMENAKDSVYRMVCILKDIVLKLDQDENKQAFNFEKQTDLVDYIENKDIPKLSRSNIEKILSQANKTLFD